MSWRRKSEYEDLERRLRADRPQPRDELVQSVSRAASGRTRKSRWSVVRVALACALTLGLVATLAALGGLSRTATAATDVVTFVQTGSFSRVSTDSGGSADATEVSPTSGSTTSSGDQYEEKITICHRRSAGDPGNTLTVSPSGATSHLSGHGVDYRGPCRR